MNKDIMKGKWAQIQGSLQKEWGKLTKDDLEQIKGNSKVFAGKMQEYYGMSRREAEKRWKDILKKFD